MSGRNIFLVLLAMVAAVGLFVLVAGPGDAPMVPVEMLAPVAPRRGPSPPPAPTVQQRVEPAPVLDDVANDAATEVERLKKEQEEMNANPAPPEDAHPDMAR